MGVGAMLVAISSEVIHSEAQERKIKGPLRVHPKNPRYFTDDGKRAI